jgi:hypothetical protein
MKDVVPARHVGGDPTLRTLKKGAVVGGALLAFYLVLQVGARLDTGEWAAGGLNPLSVLTTWLFGARPWSGTYTALAVGVAVAALVAFLVWERLRRSRPGKTRVDPVARYLGRGESFTEAAVRKHAEGEGGAHRQVVLGGVPGRSDRHHGAGVAQDDRSGHHGRVGRPGAGVGDQ